MSIRFFNIVEPVTSFFRDLAPYLGEAGDDISIIISDAEYRPERGKLGATINNPHVSVHYVLVGREYKTGKIRKIFVYIKYILVTMLLTLFGKSTDLNFFLTQPPLFSIWGYVLKLVRRQKYCVLVMDLYPDVAIQDGLLTEKAFITQFLKVISRFALRKSNCIIVIGNCMKEQLVSEGFLENQIVVIPNWVDERAIYPIEHKDNFLREQFELSNKFIVLYSGNIGAAHYFDDILEVARRLAYLVDLQFVFIGDGQRKHEIMHYKIQYHLDNIMLLPFQSTEMMAHSQSLGDIHFVSLRAGFEGIIVPSKTYGAFAAARPVIYQGVSSGHIARQIVEFNLGNVVELSQPDALEETILTYYYHRNLPIEAGQRAYQLAKHLFSRKYSLEQYHATIESIIRNGDS